MALIGHDLLYLHEQQQVQTYQLILPAQNEVYSERVLPIDPSLNENPEHTDTRMN